ncbi:hypothetical protein [Marinomonas shanghaiensis]|uniref:hypothetical protein n=1 Tax=Marinomonas shanghaiensis TaxID=2202418 RepID=UPI000DB98E6D|nr:hypothetical protein [Marinomonas shanghaiensis]
MDLPLTTDAATVASGLQTSDITAIATVVVAVCALFITIWQAWFTKKQSIIMIKPFINFRVWGQIKNQSIRGQCYACPSNPQCNQVNMQI